VETLLDGGGFYFILFIKLRELRSMRISNKFLSRNKNFRRIQDPISNHSFELNFKLMQSVAGAGFVISRITIATLGAEYYMVLDNDHGW
jgi:hypothetical protein